MFNFANKEVFSRSLRESPSLFKGTEMSVTMLQSSLWITGPSWSESLNGTEVFTTRRESTQTISTNISWPKRESRTTLFPNRLFQTSQLFTSPATFSSQRLSNKPSMSITQASSNASWLLRLPTDPPPRKEKRFFLKKECSSCQTSCSTQEEWQSVTLSGWRTLITFDQAEWQGDGKKTPKKTCSKW